MIQGVHHMAIIVSNEDSIAFYERFGFEVFKRVVRKQDTVVLLYGHGIQLEIFVDVSHPVRSFPEPLGLRHLAIRVDDIEKTIQELNLKTGSIMKDWVGTRFCFTADPDGNSVELHE